jgi:hypothetical protein
MYGYLPTQESKGEILNRQLDCYGIYHIMNGTLSSNLGEANVKT